MGTTTSQKQGQNFFSSRTLRPLLTILLLLSAFSPVLLVGQTKATQTSSKAAKPNVLFIAVDDLNHWVHHLGRNDQVITPNIDRLARRGVTFAHAYAAAPVCNPSRAALLSGLRPSTTGVYDNGTDWRPHIPESITLPTHFRKHGYWVAGAGKIYHEAYRRRSEWDDYLDQEGGDAACRPTDGNDGVGGIKFAPVDCRDEEMADYQITTWVIDQLRRQQDKPFFLACGLHKPHMPWFIPRKYFDLYPLDQIKLPPTLSNDLDDVPPEGVKMAKPRGDHAAIVKSGRWKEAVQGYLAAITFTDMNVGRLLDALDRSPYRASTIIVLWGDHGWHLGEKQHWRKFALWEEATRAPFIWVVPGLTKAGGVSERTVDFMSVYPTLAELCGLPIPPHVEGVSIRSLLQKPEAPWERPALTTYLFDNHAVRTEQWRYIRYHGGGEELYDEMKDPYEWNNLANKPGSARLKAQLSAYLPKVNKPAPETRGADDENPADEKEKRRNRRKRTS